MGRRGVGVLGVALPPLSPRAVRHAWLLDQIRQIHDTSKGVYGHRRAHADLTLALGVQVGPPGLCAGHEHEPQEHVP